MWEVIDQRGQQRAESRQHSQGFQRSGDIHNNPGRNKKNCMSDYLLLNVAKTQYADRNTYKTEQSSKRPPQSFPLRCTSSVNCFIKLKTPSIRVVLLIFFSCLISWTTDSRMLRKWIKVFKKHFRGYCTDCFYCKLLY